MACVHDYNIRFFQGRLSDIYGRKNILLLSYIGPAVGYAALGMTGSLLVLVLARVPSGERLCA